ncbi:MAG: hypothetical protein K0R58_1165, partial [Ramlibacter sp.]|nr:hypothetical protein [Ramlibacter sp.]
GAGFQALDGGGLDLEGFLCEAQRTCAVESHHGDFIGPGPDGRIA